MPRREPPNVVVGSGPVLRRITVRAPSPSQLRRGGGLRRPVAIVGVFLALVVGIAGGALASHELWKSTKVATAQAQAALNAETSPLFQQAYALQNQGKLADAQMRYLQIIKDDPLNYYAYYDLALIYQETNHDQAATVDYEKTLLINTTFQPALYNLAVLETKTDPSAAVALYQQLQALQPKNADAVAFNLGLLYLQLHDQKAGVAQLEYAIKLDPKLINQVPTKYRHLLNSSTNNAG